MGLFTLSDEIVASVTARATRSDGDGGGGGDPRNRSADPDADGDGVHDVAADGGSGTFRLNATYGSIVDTGGLVVRITSAGDPVAS